VLNHLDANENVELTAEMLRQVAIVHKVNGDLVGETFSSDTLLGQGLLLDGECESIDGAAVMLGGLSYNVS
jgi:hypothetical protein